MHLWMFAMKVSMLKATPTYQSREDIIQIINNADHNHFSQTDLFLVVPLNKSELSTEGEDNNGCIGMVTTFASIVLSIFDTYKCFINKV